MELVVKHNYLPVSVTGFIKSVRFSSERSIYKRVVQARIEIEFTTVEPPVEPVLELYQKALSDDYTWFIEVEDTFIHVAPGWIASTSLGIHEWLSFSIVFPVKSIHKTYEELCAAVMREKIEESI